jgi:hypothetical protein
MMLARLSCSGVDCNSTTFRNPSRLSRCQTNFHVRVWLMCKLMDGYPIREKLDVTYLQHAEGVYIIAWRILEDKRNDRTVLEHIECN